MKDLFCTIWKVIGAHGKVEESPPLATVSEHLQTEDGQRQRRGGLLRSGPQNKGSLASSVGGGRRRDLGAGGFAGTGERGENGRGRRCPSMIMWTVCLILVFLILGSEGQRLPNLRPVKGVLHDRLPGGGLLRDSLNDANVTRVPMEDLREALRQGFMTQGRMRSQPLPLPGSARPADPALIDPSDQKDPSGRPRVQDTSRLFISSFRKAKAEARNMSCTGYAINHASRILQAQLQTKGLPLDIMEMPFDVSLCEKLSLKYCGVSLVPKQDCDFHSPFRTIDGTCNNLRRTDQGKAFYRMARLHVPVYDDNIEVPRKTGRDGEPLPSPRLVSLRVHGDTATGEGPIPEATRLVTEWGQFLDHDLVHIPESSGPNEAILDCCGADKTHPECISISVPEGDDISIIQGRTCIHAARSITAAITTCQFVYREQMNQATSYIDGSQVYGSSPKEARKLRQFEQGKLKTFTTGSHQNEVTSGCPMAAVSTLLPLAKQAKSKRRIFFHAGDGRVNEQPGLATMHTLLVRAHNDVAEELSHINPHWTDERLYQESRKIVGALLQLITYKEWLPIILDPETIKAYDLLPRPDGVLTEYDPNADASISNVFATAALRFGHSLVSDDLRGDHGHVLPLTPYFFNPEIMCQNVTRTSALLRGLTEVPSERLDPFLVPSLTDHLFQGEQKVGLDLAALNVQRGRDHGLPGYNQWRYVCDLTTFDSFQDLTDSGVMDPETARKLQTTYKHVDDVDLFTGGLAEFPIEGGMVGPTFSCIIADQFQMLKLGDRFYFEHSGQKGSFTKDQLSALRQMSLAAMLCQNTDIEWMQPRPFLLNTLPGNALLPCPAYPRLWLRPWAEQDPNTLPPFHPQVTCRSVGLWRSVPGMDSWCLANCLHPGASFCPPSHCTCSTRVS